MRARGDREDIGDDRRDADDERIAAQLVHGRKVGTLAEILDTLRHARERLANLVEQRLGAGRHDRPLPLACGRGSNENRAMDVAHTLSAEPSGAFGGEGGLRRGVIDDDCRGAEPRAKRGDHVVDDGVVLENQVHAARSAHRVGRCRGDVHRTARALARLSSVRSAPMIAAPRSFDQPREQARPGKQCESCQTYRPGSPDDWRQLSGTHGDDRSTRVARRAGR